MAAGVPSAIRFDDDGGVAPKHTGFIAVTQHLDAPSPLASTVAAMKRTTVAVGVTASALLFAACGGGQPKHESAVTTTELLIYNGQHCTADPHYPTHPHDNCHPATDNHDHVCSASYDHNGRLSERLV
jgi:hypothetical protein